MPFSTACNTPLSNFESHQNYKVLSTPQTHTHIHTHIRAPGLDMLSPSRVCVCVLTLTGRPGSLGHGELPSAGGRERESDRLDHHAVDVA